MKSQFDEFFVYAVIRHMAREINTDHDQHLFFQSSRVRVTRARAISHFAYLWRNRGR